MKKMMMAAVGVGLTGILASCGGGSTVDGSSRITGIRTEYKLASGQFVACDNITNNPGRERKTQVAIDFDLEGLIQDITIGLKGGTSNRYDSNFVQKIQATDLPGTAGKYRITFNADSSTSGGLLPQSIVVTPTKVKVKVVTTAANSRAGYFFQTFNVTTASSSFSFTGTLAQTVDVYTNCTVTATTNEDV